MKKIVCIMLLALSSVVVAQETNFEVDANVGIPVGDLKDTYSAGFGINVAYLYTLGDEAQYQIGGTTGYLHFLGKESEGEVDSRSYVPVAAAFRFNNNVDRFYFGVDAGYAIGISPEGDNGGIYFKPLIGYNFGENLGLNLSYVAVKKKEPTCAYAAIGLTFRF